MEKSKIEKETMDILCEKFGKKKTGKGNEFMNSMQGWDMDSLEFAQFIVNVEEHFNIEIGFDEEFYTMDELVEIIKKKEEKKR